MIEAALHADRRRPIANLWGPSCVLFTVLWGLLPGCERGSEISVAPAAAEPAQTHPEGSSAELASADSIITEVSAEPAAADPAEVRPIPDFGPPAPTTLFLVAGMKGYTEPCGCTAGLHVGGLDRVVGFVEAARADQPHTIVVDGGNLLFEHAELPLHRVAQDRAKVPLLLEAHHRLGTVSTTPGPTDLALGLEYYLEQMAQSEMTLLSANIRRSDGTRFTESMMTASLGATESGHRGMIGLVGANDPVLLEGVAGVSALPAIPEVQLAVDALSAEGVQTVLLVMQGGLEATRAVLDGVTGIDFALVGNNPEETDAALLTDSGGAILQAYDQGRYVGILKLYPNESGTYADGSGQDREAIDRIDRRLDYLRSQLYLLPPALQGEEPPIVLRMRGEVDELERERLAAQHARITIPEAGGAFLYWSVAIERGYPVDASLEAAIAEYNASLRELNRDRTEIVPLGEGDVAFAGGEFCAACHTEAHTFWLTTPHSHAIETLAERDKLFDEVCISCHVTGFRQPGGSVTANLNGLENVQCEACHGPGDAHIDDPPGHTVLSPGPEVCGTCHNPEHSPMFDFERFLPTVLGPGHGGS